MAIRRTHCVCLASHRHFTDYRKYQQHVQPVAHDTRARARAYGKLRGHFSLGVAPPAIGRPRHSAAMLRRRPSGVRGLVDAAPHDCDIFPRGRCLQPGTVSAGTYRVQTVDASLDNSSFHAYRRISTTIELPSVGTASSRRQVMAIDTLELEAALTRDRAGNHIPCGAQRSSE